MRLRLARLGSAPLAAHAVRLAVASDGSLVKGLRACVAEDRPCRHQNGARCSAGGLAYAKVDAGGVDTLFLREVLADVECAFGGASGRSSGEALPMINELRVRLLIQRESDVVEASLGFIVDAHRTVLVAVKDSAHRPAFRQRPAPAPFGTVTSVVAVAVLPEIVDEVAGHRDGGCAQAGGRELRRRSASW